MSTVFQGQRPDLTPAQVAAVLVAGVPVIATLLTVFGVAELDSQQQEALTNALSWGGVLAGLLIGGDATLRTARNVVDARRDTAAIAAAVGASPTVVEGPHDPEADRVEPDVLVSDDEEFAEDGEVERLEARSIADDPDRAQGGIR